MELDDREKEAFTTKVVQLLAEFTVEPQQAEESLSLFRPVTWGISDNFFTKAEEAKGSLTQKNQETFTSLFGSLGPINLIVTIAQGTIHSKHWHLDSKDTVQLSKFLSWDELNELAKAIVDKISTYPRDYNIFIDLGELGPSIIEFDLSADVSIQHAKDSLTTDFAIPREDKIAATHCLKSEGDEEEIFWSPKCTYLRIKISGYLPPVGTGESNFQAIYEDKFFSIIGLCLALNVLQADMFRLKIKEPYFGQPQPMFSPVFDLYSPDGPEFVRMLSIPDYCRDLLQDLHISSNASVSLGVVSLLIESAKQTGVLGEIARGILNASRWYFDSYTEPNQTHAYIQAMVGLEILLGDSTKKQSLTDRLSDRISYLLAPSATVRQSIKEEFEDLYDLRSKILHGGLFLLPYGAFQKLRSVQRYLRQVIQIEANKLHEHLEASP